MFQWLFAFLSLLLPTILSLFTVNLDGKFFEVGILSASFCTTYHNKALFIFSFYAYSNKMMMVILARDYDLELWG